MSFKPCNATRLTNFVSREILCLISFRAESQALHRCGRAPFGGKNFPHCWHLLLLIALQTQNYYVHILIFKVVELIWSTPRTQNKILKQSGRMIILGRAGLP